MLSKISITEGARPGGETLQPGNSLLGPDLIIYETVKDRNEWDGKIWKVFDNGCGKLWFFKKIVRT